MIGRKRYCLDTSGLSNPLDSMPENIPIYQPIWAHVKAKIESGVFAVNKEIYDELCLLPGQIGACLQNNEDNLLLEVGQDWDWNTYIEHVNRMRIIHHDIISEYNGGRKGTVGLNDVSIVALAKTLGLPLISMEAASFQSSDKRVRIPGLCAKEGVEHLTFNDFLTKI
jgi:hypothetical protein